MGSHFSLSKAKLLAIIISSHVIWSHMTSLVSPPLAHSLLVSLWLLEDTSHTLSTYVPLPRTDFPVYQ